MNKNFCTIRNRFASKIQKFKKSFTHFVISHSPNAMVLSKIDPKQVLGIIKDFSIFKSRGLDRISNKILKISAKAIITLLTHVPNQPFVKGIFPECLETAKFHFSKNFPN